MVGASWSSAGGVGEKGVVVVVTEMWPLAAPDIMCPSGFSYEFRTLESVSISGGSNIEENSAPSQQTHTTGKKYPNTGISEIYGLLFIRI